MSTAKIARLPEAVTVHCLSFLDSRDHSRCARVCVSFRRAALLPAGFPASLYVASPPHVATASPALARMRPHRLLEIRVADAQDAELLGSLLNDQTRVRHLVLSNADAIRDAYGVDLPVSVSCAYESPKLDRGHHLVACRRLEVRVRPVKWTPWFSELLARLPSLVHLELCEFPRHVWAVLCAMAPQLTNVRIERGCETKRLIGHDGQAVGDESDFARRLLENLVHLRSLALPYTMVRHRDLFVASRSLESLEVRALDGGRPQLRLVGGPLAAPKPPVMERLTHLTAAMCSYTATDILESMPHVCRGTLTFQAVFNLAAAGCIVARLDRTAMVETKSPDDDGDGKDAGNDACDFARDGGGDDDDDGGKKRITWRCVRDALPGRERSSLARNAAEAMAKLRADWSGHDFDASMPEKECREICERLPLAGKRSPSPSPPTLRL
jgi:hypothetical protein